MLRALRQGGVIQILMAGVVFAIIAVFVVQFRAAGGQQTASLQKQCVVEVTGDCVTVKDYYAAFGLIVPPGMQSKYIKALSLRSHILDGLTERELLVHEAERVGVSVSDETLDDELVQGHAHVSLPAAQADRLGTMLGLTEQDADGYARDAIRQLPVKSAKTQKFDFSIYQRVVRNTSHRSPKEFKALQRREIIAARMRDIVRARVPLSEKEAFLLFERERSEAVVRFVSLERAWFARYAVDLAEDKVAAFAKKEKKAIDEAYDKEKGRWTAGCPLVSEILLPFGEDTTPDDMVLLQEELETAKKRIDDGEPFGLVAREISEGPTATVGGDLGCFDAKAYGKGGETLEQAVEKLQPGGVSNVVETDRGLHLLDLRGKLEGDPKKAAKVAIARRLAAEHEAGELAKKFGEALLDAAKVGTPLDDATSDLIEQFAVRGLEPLGEDEQTEPPALRDRRRPKVEISAPFSIMQNPIPSALPTASPARLAFELENPGDVHSDLIETYGGYAVMQLKERTPATREQFEQDKAELMSRLRTQKQSTALSRYIERLKKTYGKRTTVNRGLVEPAEDEEAEG